MHEICSTTTLALGSRQLAAQGAIVTRLTAIEEMAGMTLLCSDKTGTLTLNQMVIQVPLPCSFTPLQFLRVAVWTMHSHCRDCKHRKCLLEPLPLERGDRDVHTGLQGGASMQRIVLSLPNAK